ncbi:MAG: response regulator transcription factor [Clostridia bacterium]|nr:response regulator transcription factor [Clostridia bacterium]
MKYDCLIVDDEIELANNTGEYLNMFGIQTYVCYNKKECEDFFRNNEVSLILLDINLPDGSGFELCKDLRNNTDIPILFISARNTDDDKIIALNIGGDDYIEKPYSLGVLLAKIKVMLKRFSKESNSNGTKRYDDGNLVVNYNEQKVWVREHELKLTALEFKLLTYLIDNRGKLITKEELFDNVWNDKFTQDGTLNVHIRRLRMLIEEDANNPKYIITVWKGGYRFIGK